MSTAKELAREWAKENVDRIMDNGSRIVEDLATAYEAGLERGLKADRFEPEDDYDPKRAEKLDLAAKLAVQMIASEGSPSVTGTDAFAVSVVSIAAAIIAEVDRVSGEVRA